MIHKKGQWVAKKKRKVKEPPSFEFVIFERVEVDPGGKYSLEVRRMYYVGTGDPPYRIAPKRIDLADPPREVGKSSVNLSTGPARIEFCKSHNDEVWKRAKGKLYEYQAKIKERPDVFTKRLHEYYQHVEGRMDKWYGEYNLQAPYVPKPAAGALPDSSTGSSGRIVVARVLFEEEHFLEVDRRVVAGIKPTVAIADVAQIHGFKPESFKRQYYKRHFNRKGKGNTRK